MKELIFSITKKDLELSYFSGTGAGGQHRNKHQNCVRLKHPDSGAMVTGQSHKSRKANIRQAINNLVDSPKFRVWHNRKINEIINNDEPPIEEKIQEMLSPKNLRVEVKEDGKWKEVKDENELF